MDYKILTQFSGREEGAFFQIRVDIYPNGTFKGKSHIILWTKSMVREKTRKQQYSRRGLGFHKISFKHSGCIWHHPKPDIIVACPENIHKQSHSLDNGSALKLEGVLG